MRTPDSGFTLVEVLIALVLFSMIGLAGSSLLNAMIAVEARTDGRLARLGEMERTMHVISLDFEQQVAGRPLVVEGSKAVVSRYSRSEVSGSIDVEYGLENHELYRTLVHAGIGAGPKQVLLSDVDALRWQFFGRSTGWVDTWPPSPGIGARTAGPQAIAAVITVSGASKGLSGVLRRVIRLPEAVSR